MTVDLALIHPPVTLPCEPPVGVALLAAALRARGRRVLVIDANAEALQHLLQSVPDDAGTTTAARRALRNRERALRQLHAGGAAYTNLDRHRGAVHGLGELLALVGAPAITAAAGAAAAATAQRFRVGLANFSDAQLSPLCSADLRAAAARPEESPFAVFHAALVERVAAARPRLVGLSLNYLHQALPALSLAGALRRRLPAVPLFLGGALLSCWRGRLAEDALRPVVDRLVFDDGLAALLVATDGGGAGPPEPSPEVGPDYSDMPWELYLAGERIAPVATSRGCVWGRCNYCPEALAEARFLPLGPTALAAALDDARRTSGAELLHISDSTIPPAALQHLAAQRWSARWYGFARFAPDLARPEFAAALRRSGCVMLQLGLESASPAVLRRLRKGVAVTQASTTLRALRDAGVAVYLYLMFGTPGETRDDALATLDFVREHADCLQHLNTSLLNLPLGQPVEPDLLLEPLAGGRFDLTLYSGFRHSAGWDRRAARRFLEREFARDPAVAAILRRTPAVFGANHAPFFLDAGDGRSVSRDAS